MIGPDTPPERSFMPAIPGGSVRTAPLKMVMRGHIRLPRCRVKVKIAKKPMVR